jgi:hypothetical protein
MTIADAEDAYLEGSAFFEEWKKDDEAEWFKPIGDTMIAMLFEQMTPEMHAEMRAIDPESYDIMAQLAKYQGESKNAR